MALTADRRRAVMQLAAATECDPRTAARWLDGRPVSAVTAAALTAAAERLGLELPPRCAEPAA